MQAAAGATNVGTRSPSIGDPNDIPEPVPMAALTDGGHIVSTGTLAREREKFFDLLRTKYPEHGEGIEDFLSTDDTALDKVHALLSGVIIKAKTSCFFPFHNAVRMF